MNWIINRRWQFTCIGVNGVIFAHRRYYKDEGLKFKKFYPEKNLKGSINILTDLLQCVIRKLCFLCCFFSRIIKGNCNKSLNFS